MYALTSLFKGRLQKGLIHMKAVIQRVTRASVTVEGEKISSIDNGLLILLGVADGDTERDAELLTTNGAALVVSQFTLCANCSHGRRPDFFGAAKPDLANELYKYFCKRIKEAGVSDVQKGVFGADMKVELLNDGPVTIMIDSGELKK